jgi:hypothetical protein
MKYSSIPELHSRLHFQLEHAILFILMKRFYPNTMETLVAVGIATFVLYGGYWLVTQFPARWKKRRAEKKQEEQDGKEICEYQQKLNAIRANYVLLEQPDASCKTVIEKFEHYAHTCSYAIAVFTPDDEVTSSAGAYLQARPNAIYELGWFCGRLGRSRAMPLLKDGTSLFSDFGGIIQKRFSQNISEKIVEIKRDLVASGVLDDT